MCEHYIRLFFFLAVPSLVCGDRKIVRTLKIRKYGGSGSWADPVLCPPESYVYEAKLKVGSEEDEDGSIILYGISFKCKTWDGDDAGSIESADYSGEWTIQHHCEEQDQYFVAFRLKDQSPSRRREFEMRTRWKRAFRSDLFRPDMNILPSVPRARSSLPQLSPFDDLYRSRVEGKPEIPTDNGLIRFRCAGKKHRTSKRRRKTFEEGIRWSRSCRSNSAVCGFSVKIDEGVGYTRNSTITNLKLHCCK